MTERALIAYARIEAAKARIEAMKMDNKLREINGNNTFNHGPEDFDYQAREIESAIEEFHRNG